MFLISLYGSELISRVKPLRGGHLGPVVFYLFGWLSFRRWLLLHGGTCTRYRLTPPPPPISRTTNSKSLNATYESPGLSPLSPRHLTRTWLPWQPE